MDIKSLCEPVELTRILLKCKSVTPDDAGSIELIKGWLITLGFSCHIFKLGPQNIKNLYAWRGNRLNYKLCFAGHVDVVPAGDIAKWKYPPFSGISDNNILYGRGAVDMKGAIACYISALAKYYINNHSKINCPQLSLLITADEEGESIFGTKALLEELKTNWSPKYGQIANEEFGFDLTITGEPTNTDYIGQNVKIGRRGSWSCCLEIKGDLNHIAYAETENNALHKLVSAMYLLKNITWSDGGKNGKSSSASNFDDSKLHFYSITASPNVSNVTSQWCKACFNIRFNPSQNSNTLLKIVKDTIRPIFQDYTNWNLKVISSSESYSFPPAKGFTLIKNACIEVLNRTPEISTKGGTSDSRFIKNYSEVVDFGLVGKSMHKVNENVHHSDLLELTKVYSHIIENFNNY